MKSQKKLIKNHLKKYGQITPLEALQKYGCFRLGARIYELRKEGERIETKTATGKCYAIYSLMNEPDIDVHGQQEMEAEQAEQNRIDYEQTRLNDIAELY